MQETVHTTLKSAFDLPTAAIHSRPSPISTNIMAPIIKEVTTLPELSAAMTCLWNAAYNPYSPIMSVLFPVWEATEEGYAQALAEATSRVWGFHQHDASSHWIYVTDDEDGKGEVCSVAHWNFHDQISPYKDGAPELVAFWHPEGTGREFASRALNQVYRFRGERMWRPHCQLDYMFTDVPYRGKGYASMLMQWGMQRAEEKGLEVVVESSEMGHDLYKKFGLRTIEKIALDMRVERPSNTWRRLQSDLGDVLLWWMWKPSGGVYEVGKMELPWVAKRE
ncbi:hypothetical protein CJF31_00011858 [Rutstroemia sp. NJR-2017a BVV2]|nr:hypothetical protein CJF31_00011858 [Rutstroemia sp. NJR-2017a BVV2]